jgi:hypothetical protein
MKSARSTILASLLAAATVAACLGGDSGQADAQSMSIGWDRPNGPAAKDFTSGPVDVYIAIQGLTAPVRAMQVHVRITTNYYCGWEPPVPDAWSFAEGGCQSGRACFEPGDFGELRQFANGGGPMRLVDLSRDPLSGRERFVLAEVYRDLFVPQPGETYTFLRLRFDHSFSVEGTSAPPGFCADQNEPMFLVLDGASWLDEFDNEIQFARPYPGEYVIWNPDAPWFSRDRTACAGSDGAPSLFSGGALIAGGQVPPLCEVPVPVVRATWGGLKSAYR